MDLFGEQHPLPPDADKLFKSAGSTSETSDYAYQFLSVHSKVKLTNLVKVYLHFRLLLWYPPPPLIRPLVLSELGLRLSVIGLMLRRVINNLRVGLGL